ncbi:hypothetical protein SteCoe_1408 [Stentor coeruleus]|uniref:Uncharacterized protein n=1 Tax=Stentor coeruleus TaxID=5963 RepID=A0A1R2D1R3_9CILI|nr:hypothetical protein SteCoe_1408 [Stentor coeruleus]
MDVSIKAFCPKCFMTFEAGKNSSRAVKHTQILHCDKIPCTRKGTWCIRKFSSINSANRHTYCYTKEQVDKWSESCKISPDLNLNFENLHISDIEDFLATSQDTMFPETLLEGPPYKYSNGLCISDIFNIVQRKMGKEFPNDNLNEIKNAFIKMGYTSAEVLRTAKMNQGNWEFVYRDFKHLGNSVVGVAHILKKILSKRQDISVKSKY